MSWIENHPFKMAVIVSLIAVVFGAIFHYIEVQPNNWIGFFLWCPSLFVIPLAIASYSYWRNENGKNN